MVEFIVFGVVVVVIVCGLKLVVVVFSLVKNWVLVLLKLIGVMVLILIIDMVGVEVFVVGMSVLIDGDVIDGIGSLFGV